MWELVPWTGIEPRPQHWRAQNLSQWTTRDVPYNNLLRWVISFPFCRWGNWGSEQWVMHFSSSFPWSQSFHFYGLFSSQTPKGSLKNEIRPYLGEDALWVIMLHDVLWSNISLWFKYLEKLRAKPWYQKPTQHYKATILQKKINLKKRGQWPNSWKSPPLPQNSWNNPPTH